MFSDDNKTTDVFLREWGKAVAAASVLEIRRKLTISIEE